MTKAELRIIFISNVKIYHKNHTDEHLDNLSLEGLYRNIHPEDRKRYYAEIKKHSDQIIIEKYEKTR